MERLPGGGPAQPHPAQSFSSLLILMLLMFVMNSGGGSTEGGMNGSPMLGPSRELQAAAGQPACVLAAH